MKKFILGIIVGGIIFGSSVFAVTNYLYQSNEVSYTPSDTTWNVSDVKNALDNLRTTSGTALTDLKNTNLAKAVNANGDTLSSVISTLGNITNRGNKSFSITNTSAVTIPAGYYDGTGKIQTSGMMVTPTATKSITANGSNIDVKDYAKVNVNVPTSSIFGSVSLNAGSSTTINCGFYPKNVLVALGDSGRGTGYAYINNRSSYVTRWTSTIGTLFGTNIDMSYYISLSLTSTGFNITNGTNANGTFYYLVSE